MCCMLLVLGKLQLLIRWGYSLSFFIYVRPGKDFSNHLSISLVTSIIFEVTFFREKMSAIFKYLDIRLCLVLCSVKPPHDNAFGHGITVRFLLWTSQLPPPSSLVLLWLLTVSPGL